MKLLRPATCWSRLETLREGDVVEILGFHDSKLQHLGRFRLNIAAALEDDIIDQLNPEWNGSREASISSHQLSEDIVTDLTVNSVSSLRKEVIQESSLERQALLRPSFVVTVGKTYYRQGFFNVPIDYERYFAGHGASISVDAPDLPNQINGKINRTANLNHTPRIMGGARFRDWLQAHTRMGDGVRVVIHDRKHIEVHKV